MGKKKEHIFFPSKVLDSTSPSHLPFPARNNSTTDELDRLENLPNGGNVRQPKPWEQLRMSRATRSREVHLRRQKPRARSWGCSLRILGQRLMAVGAADKPIASKMRRANWDKAFSFDLPTKCD